MIKKIPDPWQLASGLAIKTLLYFLAGVATVSVFSETVSSLNQQIFLTFLLGALMPHPAHPQIHGFSFTQVDPELSKQFAFIVGKKIRFRIEIIILGELLPHFIQIDSQIRLSVQIIHPMEVIYLLMQIQSPDIVGEDELIYSQNLFKYVLTYSVTPVNIPFPIICLRLDHFIVIFFLNYCLQ